MSNVVAARFTDEVLAELDDVARELRRTRAELIRRAVEIYLAEHADHQIALERLNDPSDPVVSTEEMWRELGWDAQEPPR
jgi:RHH-type transcriptional regulator, rel operon repressor / antitoxin RelB